MSEPKSTMTLVELDSKELTVAMTWVAWAPKKEQPGGWAKYFLSSTSGLKLGVGDRVMDFSNISCKRSSRILV